MAEHRISIENGEATFVYSDDLIPLTREGETTITRASHVEPHPTKVGWLADMRPSGGPVLGKGSAMSVDAKQAEAEADGIAALLSLLVPFETREEALAAEREWLRAERGL